MKFQKGHTINNGRVQSDISKAKRSAIMRIKMKGKSPWNKNKKGVYSAASLERMSAAQKINTRGCKNGMYGKHQSESAKQLLRNKAIGRLHTVETKLQMSLKHTGTVFSKEHKDKLREAHILNPNRKYKDTSIEIKIEQLLNNIGLHYIKQHGISKIGIVDFYIPTKNLVIECDGCYYHRCPIHHPVDMHGSREKDALRTSKLEQAGYKVLRFWEHEINNMCTLAI